MNLGDPLYWEAMYDMILGDLGLNRDADYHSCRLLDSILSARVDLVLESRRRLRDLLEDNVVMVLGDGPNSGCPRPREGVLVAADAALERCLELGVLPDVVTTDLDGLSEGFVNTGEIIFVVHAHGDNADRIERLVPRIRGPLVGTAQCVCSPRIEVPGGFTDGDRAAFLAYHYGARRVYLYGFNFNEVGRLIKPSGVQVDAKSKLAKLAWSRFLLLLLKDSGYEVECLEGGCEGWV